MATLPPLFVELRATISDFESKFGAAENQINRISKKGGSDLDKLQAVGKATFLGLAGAAGTFGGIAIKEALDQEASNARLTQSLQNVHSSLTAMSPAFQKAQADARQLGFSDDAATEALAKLVAATKSPTQAIKDLSLAQDVARGRGIDLAAATDILTKVETGHVALLGRIGINVKDNTGATISQEEALKRLSALYGGQASAYADTFAGRLAVLKSQTSDLAERVGFVLIPKIESLAETGAGAIEWAQKHQTEAKLLAGVLAGPLVVAMGAYIAAQVRSIYLSGVQVALKLPQFFLSVGSAIQGTTAAEVVLNGTMASTTATMLLGAGAIGVVIARLYEFQQAQKASKDDAGKWAASQVQGLDTVQAKLDRTNQLIAEQEKNVKGVHSSWLGLDSFFSSQTGSASAKDKLQALKDQAASLGSTLKSTTTPSVDDLGNSLDDLGDPLTEAKQKAKDFDQTVQAMRSDLFAVVSANRGLRDAQDSVRDATSAVNDAQKKLQALLKQSPVDLDAVASAQADVAQSSKDVASALAEQADAQANLEKVRKGTSPEDIRKAELAVADAQRQQVQAQLDLAAAKEKVGSIVTTGIVGDNQKVGTANDLVQANLDLAAAQDNVEKAAFGVTDAQAELTRLQNVGKDGSQELKDAQQLLAEKTDAVAQAQDRARQATEKLQKAQEPDAQLSSDIAAARDDLARAEQNLAKQKDAVGTAELNAFEATQKSNQALSETPGAIDAVRASIQNFLAQYPDGAASALGLEALQNLPSAISVIAAGVGTVADAGFAAQRGGLAGPGSGGVLVTGDVHVQVDKQTVGKISQSQLALMARANGLS